MTDATLRPILVGVTGEEDVRAALDFAAGEARRRGSGIHLVHVLHPVFMAPDGVRITVEERAVRKYGRKALTEAARSLEHKLPEHQSVSTEFAHGPVARVLVNIADRAGLVVLQHQRMGHRDLVPTLSITNPVAAQASVPVVAVPHGWRETPGRTGISVGVEDLATSQRGGRSCGRIPFGRAARRRSAPARSPTRSPSWFGRARGASPRVLPGHGGRSGPTVHYPPGEMT